MGFLTQPMKQFLEAEDKRGWRKSTYYRRIIQYAQESIEELAWLNEVLPEKELSFIFDEAQVGLLINAILNPKSKVDELTNIERESRIARINTRLAKLLGGTKLYLMIDRNGKIEWATGASHSRSWLSEISLSDQRQR